MNHFILKQPALRSKIIFLLIIVFLFCFEWRINYFDCQ